jgi:hypothetical protein
VKKGKAWQTCVFFGLLMVTALAVTSKFGRKREKHQDIPIAVQTEPVKEPQTEQVIEKIQEVTKQEPPVVKIRKVEVSPWNDYSKEALQVIANEIAQQDESEFGKLFLVRCDSANSSPREFDGYGIHSRVVVVDARFRIMASTNAVRKWFRSYTVSETIDETQFQGLTSSDTIQRIVASLKDQLKKDGDFLAALRTATPP